MEKENKIRNLHFSNLINIKAKSIKFLFLLHLFLINFEVVFSEYLESYQSNSFADLDSLIEINAINAFKNHNYKYIFYIFIINSLIKYYNLCYKINKI